jgi:cytidine deaminase
MRLSAAVKKAHKLATKARQRAHAPYSKFKVGATLISEKGAMITGCNVENASYGGTVCAERTAILKAVSDGITKFTDVVVVTDAKTPAFPCALCLQVMAEFFEPETNIWVADTRKIHAVHTYSDLLPFPFGPRQLNAASVPKPGAKK